jgi:mono/diheme cytochrome c family protein
MISNRLLIAGFTAGLVITCLAFAQDAAPPPGGGRGGGRGASGGGGAAGGGRAGGGRAGGGRAGGFTQYTRPLASQDVLARGKALFDNNCSSCHATDLRGVPGKGNNILHSGVTMNDKKGELVSAQIAKHNPSITLSDADSVAVAEYIHSVLFRMAGQGSPPRADETPELNILVGDAKAGEAYFAKNCTSCHSLTGDMKGIASKYADARALQNGWVGGTLPIGGGGGRGGGGRGGGGGVGNQATVTMANGQKFEGRIVRRDDFLLILTLTDGTRKSIPLDVPGPAPKVEVKDPQEAHKKMVLALDDPDNKNMHDVTAFLWTLK